MYRAERNPFSESSEEDEDFDSNFESSISFPTQAVDPGLNGVLVAGVSAPHNHPGHEVVVHHQPPSPQPLVIAHWQPFVFMYPAADFNDLALVPHEETVQGFNGPAEQVLNHERLRRLHPRQRPPDVVPHFAFRQGQHHPLPRCQRPGAGPARFPRRYSSVRVSGTGGNQRDSDSPPKSSQPPGSHPSNLLPHERARHMNQDQSQDLHHQRRTVPPDQYHHRRPLQPDPYNQTRTVSPDLNRQRRPPVQPDSYHQRRTVSPDLYRQRRPPVQPDSYHQRRTVSPDQYHQRRRPVQPELPYQRRPISHPYSRRRRPVQPGLFPRARPSADRLDDGMKRSSSESEADLNVGTMETGACNGAYVWKIPDIARRRREAVDRKTLSLYSAPFHLKGYRMYLRVYLNGDGTGRGTHISLFLVLMSSENDALLPWPFRHNVTITLIDRNGRESGISHTFRPDPNSPSFQRPQTEMNVGSGCPQFAPVSVLADDQFVHDGTLYLKVRLEEPLPPE